MKSLMVKLAALALCAQPLPAAAQSWLAPLTVTGTPSAATFGVPYTFTPSISGGYGSKQCDFNGSSLHGLTVDSTTCALSGTPNGGGSTITGKLLVKDATSTSTLPISIPINPVANLAISGVAATPAPRGVYYSWSPLIVGGTGQKHCSRSGRLPEGLTFSELDCTIYGIPAATARDTTTLYLNISDRLTTQSLGPLSISLTPVPIKTTVFVATRAQTVGTRPSNNGLSDNTLARLEGRYRIYGNYTGATNLKLIYPTFYLFPDYTLNANSFTLTAAIEQGGVNKPVLFGGASSIAAAPTDILETSDTVLSTIAVGETVYVRTGALMTVGQQIGAGYLRWPSDNSIEQIATTTSSGTASQVSGTGVMSITGSYASATYGYGPIAAIGTVSSYTASVLVLGDSIFQGTTDSTGDGLGNTGFVSRALQAARIGFSNVARGSNQATKATPTVAPGTFLLAQYATHALVDLGTNDIFAGRTLAQVQTDLLAIWANLRAQNVKVYQMLIFPRVTCTPDCTSEANMTPVAGFALGGIRDQLNTWIRNKAADGTISGVLDLLSAVQGTDPNKYLAGLSTDGVHPTTAGHYTLVAPTQTLVAGWK